MRGKLSRTPGSEWEALPGRRLCLPGCLRSVLRPPLPPLLAISPLSAGLLSQPPEPLQTGLHRALQRSGSQPSLACFARPWSGRCLRGPPCPGAWGAAANGGLLCRALPRIIGRPLCLLSEEGPLASLPARWSLRALGGVVGCSVLWCAKDLHPAVLRGLFGTHGSCKEVGTGPGVERKGQALWGRPQGRWRFWALECPWHGRVLPPSHSLSESPSACPKKGGGLPHVLVWLRSCSVLLCPSKH